MAVKVNVPLETPGGAEIPAGAIIVFDMRFPAIKLSVELRFRVYRNLDAVKANEPAIGEVQGIIPKQNLVYDNIADFSTIDQTAIEAKALEHIEASPSVGKGNAKTITKDLLQ